jgi:hypothetical protein
VEPGLLINALLTPALAGVVSGRIYPVQAPAKTPFPYVCYQLISRVPDGSALCDLGDAARVQVSLYAVGYSALCDLAKRCRKALHGQEVQGVTLELANEFDHPPLEGALALFRSQDYTCDLPPEA